MRFNLHGEVLLDGEDRRSRWRQAELFREKAKLGARVAHTLTERRSDAMPFAAALFEHVHA